MGADNLREKTPPPCFLCGVPEGGIVHNSTAGHQERLRMAFAGETRKERPTTHVCSCCKVPTEHRGMCDGCYRIHGSRLAPKVDGVTTCPRAVLAMQGEDEHMRDVRAKAERLAAEMGPRRAPSPEALALAASFEP